MCKFALALMVASAFSLLASLVGANPAFAASVEEELEEDHELSMEFETPHTDWAQPYSLGKVRLMYFGWGSYGRGIEARDLIELMQRFDIEAQAAYYHRIVDSSKERWRGRDSKGRELGEERILRLLEQPWDCFIFHGIPLNYLPAEAESKVLKAVESGAGLVLIGVDDDGALKAANRMVELPPFLSNDHVGEAYRVKAGRAIRLPPRPQIPYHPGWEADYDYWLERVGRAMLWAANRAPRLDLRIDPITATLSRGELPAGCVNIRLTWDGRAKSVEVQARLRRSDGLAFGLGPRVQAAPGERPCIFRFRRAYPAGQYHLDVFARSKDGVEAWVTTALEIAASRRVQSLTLSRGWGEVGEKARARMNLGGSPMPGERARFQLLDARRRILAQGDRPIRDSAAEFEFTVEAWMPMLLEVRGLVIDGEGEVCSGSAYLRVTRRNRGQFNFVVWDWPKDTLAPYVEQQLARLGCTAQLGPGEPPLTLAAANISHVPYTTRIMTAWDEKGYMKPTCWNDEATVDKWVDSVVSKYVASREHGALVYSLGDETATTGSCVHPACLQAYRKYLKQEYGEISALNTSWGADYENFDQVNLLVAGDNDEAEALRRKLYPRWYDRQAFKAYNFAKLCERFGKRFKELDPQALTGFEGAGRFSDGTDIDLICRTNGFWTTYGSAADEVIRSIAPRNFIRSNWMGYDRDAESLLRAYWRMVTRGADSVWWWRWDGFGTYRGLLASHLAPYRAIKEMMRDTQVVRDGLGAILTKCEREDDGVAILYSFPSTFANRIEAGPSYGKYEDDHKAWHRALRSLGLQFSYVTDRMLRQGEFQAKRFKALILPQTEAIGPAEAEVIRQFARSGGTVIADVRPGIYDGHCKPLKTGCLDDLFGVERTATGEAAVGNAKVTGRTGGARIDASVVGAALDLGLRTTTGLALGHSGTAPVCIANQAGRGRAILLNFTMSSFSPDRGERMSADSADFMTALLAAAGVKPVVIVTDADGKRVHDTEVIRWRGPGVDFLALFGGKDERVQVRLPQARHVCDLRERAYLGRTATFAARKMPNRATFFALSARALPRPSIKLSKSEIAPGQRLTAAISCGESPALHAVRLSARLPDGTSAEWFDHVVVVGKRGATAALPIACNDPTGAWTILATDLYTNKTATARFKVK